MAFPFIDSLAASVNVQIAWQAAMNVIGQASPMTVSENYGSIFSWTFGSSTGQANVVGYLYGSLAGGGNSSIDLMNLSNPQSNFNVSFAFTLIKGMVVELLPNPDGSVGSSGITIGGGANAWPGWFGGGTPTIDSGGLSCVQGSDVGKPVNATNRFLNVSNNDSSNFATVRVFLTGLIATGP